MHRAAAGIDDQGLLSGTRAVLGESIARGTDNALENVGVLATLTSFDGAADALSNAIETYLRFEDEVLLRSLLILRSKAKDLALEKVRLILL